jgi:hypothetical protein
MAKLLAKSGRAFWQSPPTAAPVAPARPPASSIVLSKRACSGFLTKIIRLLVASKSIRTFVSVAKNAPAKDLTGLSWMAVPGTLSRWCLPMTGKRFMESRFPIRRLRRRPPKVLNLFLHSAPCGFEWLSPSEPLVVLSVPARNPRLSRIFRSR